MHPQNVHKKRGLGSRTPVYGHVEPKMAYHDKDLGTASRAERASPGPLMWMLPNMLRYGMPPRPFRGWQSSRGSCLIYARSIESMQKHAGNLEVDYGGSWFQIELDRNVNQSRQVTGYFSLPVSTDASHGAENRSCLPYWGLGVFLHSCSEAV